MLLFGSSRLADAHERMPGLCRRPPAAWLMMHPAMHPRLTGPARAHAWRETERRRRWAIIRQRVRAALLAGRFGAAADVRGSHGAVRRSLVGLCWRAWRAVTPSELPALRLAGTDGRVKYEVRRLRRDVADTLRARDPPRLRGGIALLDWIDPRAPRFGDVLLASTARWRVALRLLALRAWTDWVFCWWPVLRRFLSVVRRLRLPRPLRLTILAFLGPPRGPRATPPPPS